MYATLGSWFLIEILLRDDLDEFEFCEILEFQISRAFRNIFWGMGAELSRGSGRRAGGAASRL
jgi:hypothetical protein